MMLKIKAVDGRLSTLVDAQGALVRGRFAGRGARAEILDDGELVADHTHYRRAILRGDLELVAEQEDSK